jgi:hypothetical protein
MLRGASEVRRPRFHHAFVFDRCAADYGGGHLDSVYSRTGPVPALFLPPDRRSIISSRRNSAGTVCAMLWALYRDHCRRVAGLEWAVCDKIISALQRCRRQHHARFNNLLAAGNRFLESHSTHSRVFPRGGLCFAALSLFKNAAQERISRSRFNNPAYDVVAAPGDRAVAAVHPAFLGGPNWALSCVVETWPRAQPGPLRCFPVGQFPRHQPACSPPPRVVSCARQSIADQSLQTMRT